MKMIIMINGAFGVGKSAVTEKLMEKLDNTMLYDPEEMGFLLRNILPLDIRIKESLDGDFQDFILWKEMVVNLGQALKNTYQRDLIVPMTIRKPEYLGYILQGFKETDEQTYHFCLTATKETIFARLRERGEEEGDWSFQQTEKCLKAYEEYDFGEYIDTENRSIEESMEVLKTKINDRLSNEG